MTRLTGFIMGFIGLALSIPLVGYVISPALRRQERDWAEAGSLKEVTSGDPQPLSIVVTTQDGWIRAATVRSVWAVQHPDGQVVVYAPLCTHLGCAYHWEQPERKFFCPCHNGIYDIEGKVLSGPPPRPLDRLPVKVEQGRLYVIYKEFKSGTPEQIEL